MTQEPRPKKVAAWVVKNADSRDLDQQFADVDAYGGHGTARVLRNQLLAALGLGQPAPTGHEVLLFGCYRPFNTPYIVKDVVALCKRLGVSHTWLDAEDCCGLPHLHQAGGRRAEVEAKIRGWLAANAAKAAAKGGKRQVFCCSGCAHVALANYRDGEGLPGVYVSDVLLDALEAAGSVLAVPPATVAYFEGCHTSTRSQYPTTRFDWGRYRRFLDGVDGLSVVDLPANKCCKTQAGGIIAAAKATGAAGLVCACSGCNPGLRAAGEGALPVWSYPELLRRCLDGDMTV